MEQILCVYCLVSAILMETSEEWETSRKYLTLEYDQLPN